MARLSFNRAWRIMLWLVGLVAGGVLSCVLLVVALIILAMNLPQGRHFVEQKLPGWTGGMVHLHGVSGMVPWHVHLQRLTLQDARGSWLEVDDADLRWSLLALLHERVSIDSLTVSRLWYGRAPVSQKSSVQLSSSDKKSSGLAIAIKLAHLDVSRIELGPEVLGQAMAFSATGKAFLKNLAPFLNGVTLDTLPASTLALDVKRLDAAAHLRINLAHYRQHVDAILHYDEAEGGFASSLGRMPELDLINVDLSTHGTFRDLKTMLVLRAGPAHGRAAGTVDIRHRAGDLALNLVAPAMTLGAGVGWGSMEMAMDLHGPFFCPSGQAWLDIRDLSARGSGASHVQLAFTGRDPDGDAKKDELHLLGAVEGMRLPGKNPAALASSPVTLDATLHPLAQEQPFHITIKHVLARLVATGYLAPALKGHVSLALPDLKPLAAIGGVALHGATQLDADVALPGASHMLTSLDLTGRIAVTGGQEQAVRLIGSQGTLGVHLLRDAAGVVELRQFALNGQRLDMQAHGMLDPRLKDGRGVALSTHVTLSDLSAAYPILLGDVGLGLDVNGPLDDMAVQARMDGTLGVDRAGMHVMKGPLHLETHVDHLLSRPEGTLRLDGELDKTPVQLEAAFRRDVSGMMDLAIHHLTWKGLHGGGHLMLPKGKVIPSGDLDISIKRLDAFQALVGQPMSGSFSLGVHSLKENGREQDALSLAMQAQGHVATYGVRQLTLKGTVDHASQDPVMDMTLRADRVKAKMLAGSFQARLTGPQKALALVANGHFQRLMDAPARLELSLVNNLPERSVTIKSLTALIKGKTLRLLAPVVATYGDIWGVDRLRLSARPQHGVPMQLDVKGTVKPRLDLTVSATHVTPALAEGFVPSFRAEGQITAQARLKGSMNAPEGTATVEGHGLRMLSGPAEALPPASFRVNTVLKGQSAQLVAEVRAGSHLALSVKGGVPLTPSRPLALTTQGTVDLTLTNPILGAYGMGMAGTLAINLGAKGTLAKPLLSGTVALHHGSFDHYAQGVHVQNIDADLLAQGDQLVLHHLTMAAGEGTIGLMGTIGAFRSGLPIDLHLVMNKAQPVRSDMLEEEVNARLHIAGLARTRLNVTGAIDIPSASITLPQSMPVSVPQLNVVEAAQRDKPATESPLVIGLDVDVTSPGKLFVRGYGLFAELQGKLHIGGLGTAPKISGGFDLRRGNFNLAGIYLNFTHGQVSFNGMGVGHRLDPTLDFRADRNGDDTLASLLVTGYASKPKLDFTSTPPRSRDEILSILLFGKGRAGLSAAQLAELAAALVQIGGGQNFDPLGTVRNALGLDQLTIGGGSGVDTGGTSIEAGKYVMKGVYVGAKEGLSGGGGTQAQVKVDLARHLKLKTVVGTGGQVSGFTTPENDPGSSVGLSYGIDY